MAPNDEWEGLETGEGSIVIVCAEACDQQVSRPEPKTALISRRIARIGIQVKLVDLSSPRMKFTCKIVRVRLIVDTKNVTLPP